MSLSRRQFLTWGGALAGTSVAAGAVWAASRPAGVDTPSAVPATTVPAITAPPSTTSTMAPATVPPSTAAPAPSADGRVLVVLQLSGGNDGLDTLVPVQGAYHDARPTIGQRDDALVPFPGTDAYGLHPAMAPLAPLLAAGRVGALEAIGYPHPDRSHFAALDDWWSGTPGRSSTSGWLGRWLDLTAAGDDDPLRAVALGAGAPALLGDRVRPTVVLSPKAFALRGGKGVDRALPGAASVAGADLAARYRRALADASAAVATFGRLAEAAPAEGEHGEGADGEATRLLATAAQLVVQVPATRVVQVTVGGFDTHAGQAATHERLLADVAAGIAGFFGTLDGAGASERVVLMTVSEFGRRVHENGSGGTDHGKASVSFAVGPAVRGGLYGAADLSRLDDGDLAPQLDVRQLYAAALGWLGGPADEVLGGPYDAMGLVRA